MRTRAVLPVVIALVVAVAGLHLPTGTAASAPDGPHVRLEVHVQESGSAIWTVTASYSLNSSSEVAAFDDLADEYEANETTDGPQIETFRELASQAAEETGRSMGLTVEAREAEVQNRSRASGEGAARGILRLRFEWTNFARTVNDTLAIGDAFGPAWELGAEQELVIRPPADYSVDTVEPSTSVQNGVIRWRGPQQFGADQPAVRYVPGGASPPEEEGQNLLLYAAALGLLIVVGGALVYGWRRREPNHAGASESSGAAGDDDGAPAVEEAAPGDDGSEAPDGDEAGASTVDPELLSDEERVEQLLEANGGRMKQAAIVEETGWSNAKVSQLLSAMDDSDRVEKLRIGRENLIRLPDEDGPE